MLLNKLAIRVQSEVKTVRTLSAPPSVLMKRIITDNGGEELRCRAAGCHEGRSSHVLAEVEALQKENNIFNLSSSKTSVLQAGGQTNPAAALGSKGLKSLFDLRAAGK